MLSKLPGSGLNEPASIVQHAGRVQRSRHDSLAGVTANSINKKRRATRRNVSSRRWTAARHWKIYRAMANLCPVLQVSLSRTEVTQKVTHGLPGDIHRWLADDASSQVDCRWLRNHRNQRSISIARLGRPYHLQGSIRARTGWTWNAVQSWRCHLNAGGRRTEALYDRRLIALVRNRLIGRLGFNRG